MTAVVASQYSPPAPTQSRLAARAQEFDPCPSCGGTTFKKLSVVHATGVSLGEGTTRGAGLSLGGSVGLFGARTSTVSQTMLSAAAAPPEKRKFGVWTVIGVLFGLVFLGSGSGDGALVGGILLLVCGGLIVVAIMFNTRDYPELLAAWNRKYMCERCGTVLTPDYR